MALSFYYFRLTHFGVMMIAANPAIRCMGMVNKANPGSVALIIFLWQVQ